MANSSSEGATRLLWVNHFAITPGQGGGTRHFEIARQLLPLGWRPTVAASDFDLYLRVYNRRPSAAHRGVLDEDVGGVRFRWLWAAPYRMNDWRRGLNWLSFAWSLLRWPREKEPYAMVIGSSPHLFAALAAERLASRWNVPFVLEVRDLWPESLLAAGGNKGCFYVVLDAVARYLYRRAARIVVLARGTAEYLVDRGIPAAKMVYVPNGVDAGSMSAPKPTARRAFTLVYAGAHGPANGLDAVLGAAEILKAEGRFRFLFVGDGPAKIALKEDAARRGLENTEFRDPVPKASMAEVFAECDAGLMVLKETELFSFGVSPNKLFDYLAAELPVVCNVPGEVAGMLRDSRAGEQAANGTATALAEAVRRLAARSAAERGAMGRAGREWVAREHSREVLAARLDKALSPLVVRS